MKFNETFTELIRLDLEVGAVPALMGEAGIGKSSFVANLAKTMGTRSFTLACNQLADKADLTGARLVPYERNGETKYRQVFYPHDAVQSAIDYAVDNPSEWPILFFDEVNRSNSDVTSATMTVVTERRLGREALPSNLRIMVAGNNKGNVVALDDASLSRFSIYQVEPDAHTLMAILGDELNPHVKAVLTRFPHLVFEKSTPAGFLADGLDDDDDGTANATYSDLLDSGEEMLQLTTPRTIESISRWLNAADPIKIQEYLQTQAKVGDRETTLLNEVIEAHIGNTEFATHLVSEIANAVNTGGATQAARLAAPKPNSFASLRGAGTVNDLEELIGDLTARERSANLLYALYEKQDNQVLIQQLAQQVDAIEPEHNRLLLQLAANSELNDRNIDHFTATDTNVAKQMKAVFDMMA